MKPEIIITPENPKYKLMKFSIKNIVYHCDETNNSPDILDNKLIISRVYLGNGSTSEYWSIHLDGVLSFILQNTNYSRNKIMEIGISFFKIIKKEILKRPERFYSEWKYNLTSLFLEYILNELGDSKLWFKIKECLLYYDKFKENGLIKSYDVIFKENDPIVVQTKLQFYKNNGLVEDM